MWNKFTFYKQHDATDCGLTCLRMIAMHYGRSYSLGRLKELGYASNAGVSIKSISETSEKIGFRSLSIRSKFDQLYEEVPLPCIVHWNQNHFIVVYKVSKTKIYVADPAFGLLNYTKEEFIKGWIGNNIQGEGVLILFEPSPDFYQTEEEVEGQSTYGLEFLFKYLRNYKRFVVQLTMGIVAGSILQLLFPFLTQAIVDVGITNQDIGFVYLILIAQLMLFVGRTALDFIRTWIILHMGTRINISVISDFLIKIMRLPLSFFEARHTGDLLQRIYDHNKIEYFLTSTVMDFLFSIVTLVVYGIVIALYSTQIFIVYLIGSTIYFSWIFFFLKKRKELDYKRFSESGANTNSLIELINGMAEIKLNNAETSKRWNWERSRAKLYKISIKSLSLKQVQEGGSLFLNEAKNIFVSFIAAKQVIEGNLTLGMMLAVSYMIGQMNAPLTQLLTMILDTQDARISMERLGEIHSKPDEEDKNIPKVTLFPEKGDLSIKNLSFRYEGQNSQFVFENLDLVIPYGKTTAIVGASGSGKTTLMKLLIKFYPPTSGYIRVGGIHLDNLSGKLWREKCGAVLQDGYIFSDTIINNIAISGDELDREKLFNAVETANIKEFIESLPLGYNTKIGRDGVGMSGGQKQRILIARAVYKQPEFIFFDEATSALDANNEKIIMKNLDSFFRGRTAIVIAHRLSTVKNADQIVVLEKGKIIEQGTHDNLAKLKGAYYNLVKNQLELGN